MCHCGPYLPGWPLTVPSVPPIVPPLLPNSNGTKQSKRGWEDGLSQAGVRVGERASLQLMFLVGSLMSKALTRRHWKVP